MSNPLKLFADLNFSYKGCEVIAYDRKRPDVFTPPYLTKLYNLCAQSGRSSLGILPDLFCGMADLTHDSITSYLAARPVILLTMRASSSTPDSFIELGFIFPTVFNGIAPERSGFLGYGFFQHAWGTPEMTTLGILGLAYFFHTYQLKAIHGVRYADNALTARYTRKFGFKDNGLIPRYMGGVDGRLRDAISSTLTVEDFEQTVERWLIAQSPSPP